MVFKCSQKSVYWEVNGETSIRQFKHPNLIVNFWSLIFWMTGKESEIWICQKTGIDLRSDLIPHFGKDNLKKNTLIYSLQPCMLFPGIKFHCFGWEILCPDANRVQKFLNLTWSLSGNLLSQCKVGGMVFCWC